MPKNYAKNLCRRERSALEAAIEQVAELKVELGRHDERIKDLEEYRNKLNGSMNRLADSMDKLKQTQSVILGSVILLLAGVIIDLLVRLVVR